MMSGFSPDETRRWDAWQHANALSAHRSDLLCRMSAATMLTATFVALAVALWIR